MPVKSPLQLPGLRPRESPGGGRCVRAGACSNGKTLAELGGPGCITVTIRAAQNGNLRAGGKPARRRECPTRSVPSVALGAARYPAKRKKGRQGRCAPEMRKFKEEAMQRLLRDFSLSVVGLLIASAVASAQLSTARLSGRVTDQSDAVLPGVTVTVTQTNTGFTRTDVTDGNGAYVMPNLPTGPYRLEVSLSGFRTYVQTGIVLQVAASPVINAVLAVGALQETVTVEGAAPLVDVQSSGISDVVRTQEILAMPLNGRNAV